jgi:hypothetical protein
VFRSPKAAFSALSVDSSAARNYAICRRLRTRLAIVSATPRCFESQTGPRASRYYNESTISSFPMVVENAALTYFLSVADFSSSSAAIYHQHIGACVAGCRVLRLKEGLDCFRSLCRRIQSLAINLSIIVGQPGGLFGSPNDPPSRSP